MAKLILVRHGITSWNQEGRWQGKTDVPLSAEGRSEIDKNDEFIRDEKIDIIYTSTLSRVRSSEWLIVHDLNLNCPVIQTPALDERDYGIYVGKNKWDFEKEIGHKEFDRIRRGWDTPIPHGETIEDVYNRVIPFYKDTILKNLTSGKNVLVVSSGNTLRALIKYLDNLSVEEIENLDLGFAAVIVYDIIKTGQVSSKIVKTKGIFPSSTHMLI